MPQLLWASTAAANQGLHIVSYLHKQALMSSLHVLSSADCCGIATPQARESGSQGPGGQMQTLQYVIVIFRSRARSRPALASSLCQPGVFHSDVQRVLVDPQPLPYSIFQGILSANTSNLKA